MTLLKSAYRQYREEGYLIIPQVFHGEELERLRAACDRVLERYTAEHDRSKPQTDFNRIPHLNDSRWHPNGREALLTLLETVADPRCLGPVEQIFAGPSLFRCTQYFVNPRFASEEGNWHRDTQFGRTDEEEKAWLKQVGSTVREGVQFQIALVDNDDIEYVPYSANRYDSPEEYYIRLADNRSHCREGGMPNALRISQKAGDAVIFNPNGLHRGRYHTDKPRRTLMLTYTPFDEPTADRWSNQPWFEEPGYLDGLSDRAQAYFRPFRETYKDFWAQAAAAKE